MPVSMAAEEKEVYLRLGRGVVPLGGYTPRAGYSDTMLNVTLSVLNQLQPHQSSWWLGQTQGVMQSKEAVLMH